MNIEYQILNYEFRREKTSIFKIPNSIFIFQIRAVLYNNKLGERP